MTYWHPEQVEKLRTHVAEGLTGGQVGTLLGKTRSAVMGMAKRQGLRFGLNREPRVPKRPVKKRVMLAPLPQCTSMPYLPLVPTMEATEPPMPVKRTSAPALGSYTIMELTEHTCRWPIGDRHPFSFCGAYTDGVYCPRHKKLAFDRARSRNVPYSKVYSRPYSR